MTARPTDLPDWASSPGDPSDVSEPSASKQALGWLFREYPPYNWVNWFWNRTAQWIGHFATSSSRFETLDEAIDETIAGDTFILDENDGAEIPGDIAIYEPLVTVGAAYRDPEVIAVTGTSFVGGDTGNIAAVSRDGTTTVATYTTTNTVTTLRSIAADGRYVVVAYDDYVECFDHDTGASQWVYDHGGAVNDVAIGPDAVFMVGADVASVSCRSLDLAAGTSNWDFDHGAALQSVEYAGFQLLIGGAASAHTSSATFRAIESATGKDDTNEGGIGASAYRAIYDSTSGSFDGPGQIATDGRLFAMKTGASTFSLNGLAGTQIATTTMPNAVKSLAMDHELVICGTSDGVSAGEIVALEKAQLGVVWFSLTYPTTCVDTDGAAVWFARDHAAGLNNGSKLYRGNGGPQLWRRADLSTEQTLPLRQLAVPAL